MTVGFAPPQGSGGGLSAAQDATITGDWTFNGAVVFAGSVTSSSVFLAPDGGAGAPAYSFSSDPDTGFYSQADNALRVASAGAQSYSFGSLGFAAKSAAWLGWDSDGTFATFDVRLYRDAANTLALRNGTNAQAYRVFNTYTSATDNEYVALRFNTNVAQLLTVKGSAGGTARDLALGTDATARWTIGATTGHLLAATDNSYDIGASGANRPKDLYLSGSITTGANISVGNNILIGGTSLNIFATNKILYLQHNASYSSALNIIHAANSTATNSSGTMVGVAITPTYNQSGTAAATDLLINRTETAVGSGAQYLIDAQVGSTSKFKVTNAGAVTAAGLISALNFASGQYVQVDSVWYFSFASRSKIHSPADSIIRLSDSAGADFDRLQFGGTTSSFPALRRNGTDLDVCLADGTGGAALNVYGDYASASDYQRCGFKVASTTLSSVSGATVTASSLIPDGAFVVGVTTRVDAALGETNGTTGYAVGDGVDANRWGDVVGVAIGTASGSADATADATGFFTAANDVVLTAAGGNFDATGDIKVSVYYFLADAT